MGQSATIGLKSFKQQASLKVRAMIDIVVIPAEGSPSRHLQQTPGPQPSVSSQCCVHLKTT